MILDPLQRFWCGFHGLGLQFLARSTSLLQFLLQFYSTNDNVIFLYN